jgi:lipid-binding SYLF domain-containing protein
MSAIPLSAVFSRAQFHLHKGICAALPIALVASFLALTLIPGNATAHSAPRYTPAKLLQSAEPLVTKFFTAKHWEAVRNLTGIARAVVIVPKGGQVGLLIGGQWGEGFMFIRHGENWSDPVFVKLGSFQLGFLAGGQSVDLIGALLTKRALDRVLAGKAMVSGSGDLTVGAGISARAAGGTTGGIEFMSVSTDKGLYFGGSFEDLHIRIDQKLNRLAYGKNFDLDKIVRSTGGAYAPARDLRKKLQHAAHQAIWGQ